ncbi:MAG: hypothetical protein P1U74_07855 [Legionellaceae bacterium]|nr:hypothetical protein [Legionellaceae bacterium]
MTTFLEEVFSKTNQAKSVFAHKLNVQQELFFENEFVVQDTLAPILRDLAVDHLHNSTSVASRTFRGEGLPKASGKYKEYLAHQQKQGSWASDIEAIALGEALRCNVVVTSIYEDRPDATWCIHLEDRNAPTIHLYNDNNHHWTNDPYSKTKGEGDCLYHAVAKELQKIATPAPQKSALVANCIFQRNTAENDILSKQTLIYNALDVATKNHQTPVEMEMAYQKEQIRMSLLSESELDLIAKDYLLALQIAQGIEPKDHDGQLENDRGYELQL